MKYSNHYHGMGKHLQIVCDFPVSLAEVIDRVITDTVKLFGTQLEAARQLGITPQTVSRRLNHGRKRLGHLAKNGNHPIGAGGDGTDPLPPGGQELK
jgi:hypothetical protein